jgi:hypothetical protein
MRSPGRVNAGQSWSYNIPARPGDLIELQARALDKFIAFGQSRVLLTTSMAMPGLPPN